MASPRGGRKIPPNNPKATNLENSDAGRKGSKEQLRKGKLGNQLKGWSEDRVERAERGYVKAIKSRDPQGQAEEEKRPEKAERGPDRQGCTSLMYQTPTPNDRQLQRICV